MILSNNRLLFCLIIIALFVNACANVANLEGGNKDITPPKLDSLRSTRNFQTKFSKQPIELTFNEWIKFEDPNQIVVSPPLEKKPNVQLKGKTVKFKFDDSEILRSNATYTINFGESIKDLTEGNKTKVRFVFSTGEVIDSLKASFKIFDAITSEPLENILVLLYENTTDSVVTKERPFYFAKTDKEGNCTIENLKKGKFKVFALNDGNLNYKYDLPTEKTGFLSSLINIEHQDSIIITPITVFEPQLPIRIKEKNAATYGQVKVVLSQNANAIKPKWDDVGQTIKMDYQADTLRVWYNQDTDKNWKLFILNDTISIKPSNKEAFLKKEKLIILSPSIRKSRGAALNPELPITTMAFSKSLPITFNHPIFRIDTSKINIVDDTTKIRVLKNIVQLDSSNCRKVLFSNKTWQENHSYTIKALPGAFTDLFGLINDTISFKLKISEKKNFGDIALAYSGLSKENQYIIQLLNNTGLLIEEQIIKNTTNGSLIWTTLEPTAYKLNIITDANKNGRWDSGNYYEKRQPESIFTKKLTDLKANWTLETEVNLDSSK